MGAVVWPKRYIGRFLPVAQVKKVTLLWHQPVSILSRKVPLLPAQLQTRSSCLFKGSLDPLVSRIPPPSNSEFEHPTHGISSFLLAYTYSVTWRVSGINQSIDSPPLTDLTSFRRKARFRERKRQQRHKSIPKRTNSFLPFYQLGDPLGSIPTRS